MMSRNSIALSLLHCRPMTSPAGCFELCASNRVLPFSTTTK